MGKTYKRTAPKKGGSRNNERLTRSKKSKQLTNGLEDPAQVEKELNEQLKSMGLYAADTVGDGNCLFRALSDQMYGYPEHHSSIRKDICDFLDSHPDRFAGFVDGLFDHYVKSMRETGTYGGHLELSAYAQLKQKRIKIVQPGLVYLVSGGDESLAAERAREEKEEERKVAQDAVEPGTEGPPPSERERRRLRREAKMAKSASMTSEATVIDESTQDAVAGPSRLSIEPVEAYGPLYIAYHKWEHYSSIRNLEGPHSGLPRIKERYAAGTHGSVGKGKATEDAAEEDVANENEALILQSVPGHTLAEVRSLLSTFQGDFDSVVEALIARDAEEEKELDKSSPMALKERPTPPAAPGTGASTPSSAPSDSHAVAGGRPEKIRNDHLRAWRAGSPSSVDTAATYSSTDAGSVSTHATTEEAGGASPQADAGEDSGRKVRGGKRAAETDAMTASLLREPTKRRSQSPQSRDSVEFVGTSADEQAGEAMAREVEPSSSGTVPSRHPAEKKHSKPMTQREKRDLARDRKREREVAKALQRKARASGLASSSVAHKGDDDHLKPTSEMRSFVELRI